MREFTWWRRFHGVYKIPKQHLYKGAPELLQRIEFGEFEFNHLGREIYLEDKIFEWKVNEIKKEKPWITEASLEDQVVYIRKKTNKRKTAIMQAHLDTENALLYTLKQELAKEFNMTTDAIGEIMELFDGTTRELYFHLMSLTLGRTYDAEQIPRLIQEQPRHILKPKERKWMPLWVEVIKERNYQPFLNWHP
jgi:hypothetical protein